MACSPPKWRKYCHPTLELKSLILLGKIGEMKKGLLLSLLLLIVAGFQAFAYEQADAFIVKIFDDRVRVLSPKKFDERLTVIIENKTLTLIKGRLETDKGEFLKFVSISPNKSESLNVRRLKTDRLFFVPLAPPSQKVELKLGNKPYEIPPRQ